MRELGRIIRTYAHSKQTVWDQIINRAESVINATEHRSTGFRPIDLHGNIDNELKMDERLLPEGELKEKDILTNIEFAARKLEYRMNQRRRQAEKYGEAERYTIGRKVWIKLHRRSDKSRRLTKKIHLVYSI